MAGILCYKEIPCSTDENRCSAEEMDEIRHKNIAYEYLCHLEEAKKWLESMLKEMLPPCTQLEENLRNGILLAKLGHLLAPEVVPIFRIYDLDSRRYNNVGLQFRHTDNINYWLKSLETINLPKTFHPETTDVYDKKNMPKVIYCIHALGTHLFKLGKAPLIQDLYGKIKFSDDEINGMSEQLQKCGVPMPSFQGIGRLLSNEPDIDPHALHNAIVEVNQAIDSKDCKYLLEKLANPAMKLKHVLLTNAEHYFTVLSAAKSEKVEAAQNKSLNGSYTLDEYDEILDKPEIQGHITFTNVHCKWNEILNAIRKNDSRALYVVLMDSCLELTNVKQGNEDFYAAELQDLMEDSNILVMTSAAGQIEFLQNIVNAGNKEADIERKRKYCIDRVNAELEKSDYDGFLESLRSLEPFLPSGTFQEFAVPLYYEEMKMDVMETGEELGYSDVVASLRVLSDIAAVSAAVDVGCPDRIWEALSNPNIHISSLLEQELKLQYWRALTACRQFKMAEQCSCTLLCYMDIHDCIALVNTEHSENNSAIASLQQLNQAVVHNDKTGLYNALQNPALKICHKISNRDIPLLLKLLQVQHSELAEGMELWLVDVQETIVNCMTQVDEVCNVWDWLHTINAAFKKNDKREVISCITSSPKCGQLDGRLIVNNKDISRFYTALYNHKVTKMKHSRCKWTIHHTSSKRPVYLNLDGEPGSFTWERPYDVPEDAGDKSRHVTIEEMQAKVQSLNSNSCNGVNAEQSEEDWIIRLQSRARGYLVRKRVRSRLCLKRRLKEIIKIQRWWRVVLKRKQRKAAKSAQWTLSKKEDPMEYYRRRVHQIVKVQALWRGRQTRRVYLGLVHQPNSSFKVVRHFVPLLEFSTEDYQRELQLQALKAEVVQAIRHNSELSKQLDKMDVTIGLLVENRTTIQDVLTAGKKLNEAAKGGSGLKALCASSRRQLSAYQHLFYTLQTSPHYLAKLLFCLPQSRCTSFLRVVILRLFNFTTTSREEYLLLRLLQHALHEEIKCKISKPSDVVSGDPLVLNVAVNYARQHYGQNTLSHILGPIVMKVLNNKMLTIDTNPLNIYNRWRIEMETETGKPSDLPNLSNPGEALRYDEVCKRLNMSIDMLKTNASMFLNHIMESKAAIPYGLLFLARELRNGLQMKFPDVQEKEVLKVVGNLIYYRFINSAIVAPDAFDILPPEQAPLTNSQRHNLASIAKILQFAASKKGFGEESPHLTCLNPFLVECHEKFKQFLGACCDVEDLESHFCITEFTEATLMNQPSTYITLQELRDVHRVLLDYAEHIAPDQHDVLHELLADLGPLPTASQLLGYNCDETSAEVQLAQTEVCLTLVNKFEVDEDDRSEITKLFIKTKELLVDVLPFLSGHNLPGALRIEPTVSQEQGFLQKQQSKAKCKEQTQSGLRECKARLRKLLSQLEDKGLVSRDDGYQTLISSIGKDICNKGRYRTIQAQELQTVRATKKTLDEKTKFFEDKVKFYNEYTNKCLENIGKSKRVHSGNPGDSSRKLKKKLTLKYTGVQLKEKGVVTSIEGLPSAQFKNVLFEISPSDVTGTFVIKGKYMGVELETVEIDIKKLLQLQYEGIGVMDIFGKAKININLLIFLLNKKFYFK